MFCFFASDCGDLGKLERLRSATAEADDETGAAAVHPRDAAGPFIGSTHGLYAKNNWVTDFFTDEELKDSGIDVRTLDCPHPSVTVSQRISKEFASFCGNEIIVFDSLLLLLIHTPTSPGPSFPLSSSLSPCLLDQAPLLFVSLPSHSLPSSHVPP